MTEHTLPRLCVGGCGYPTMKPSGMCDDCWNTVERTDAGWQPLGLQTNVESIREEVSEWQIPHLLRGA